MKKIFTLIAAAMLTAGAYAQTPEVFKFDPTTTKADVTAGKTYTTESTTLVVKEAASKIELKSQKGYLKSLGLTSEVDVSGEMKDRYVLYSGTTNPIVQDGDAKISYTPDNKTLPQTGCFFIFTATKAGTVKFGMVLNADKNFFVVDQSTQECLDPANVPLYDDANNTAVAYGTGETAYQASAKVSGTATFEVEANKSYYIFCTGSKLGFIGYVFTPAGAAGVNSINAEATAAPAVKKYVENGQVIIEKAGKKFTVAGAQLK